MSASDDSASPERPVGTVQYLLLTNSPQKINADDLIKMSLLLKGRYTLNGASMAWVMNRATAATVRKLKDPSTGLYMWQPSLQAGVPDMLLGYPVRYSDSMPSATADQYPIALANWRSAYVLCDRVGSMMVSIDNNITTPGEVKYYIRRVVGGCVLNDQAIRLLRIAD